MDVAHQVRWDDQVPLLPATKTKTATEGPWRSLEAVEFATLAWVDWFNMRRQLGRIGDIPPAEFETQYYSQVAVA